MHILQEVEVDLLIRTADCYREIGELDTAVMFYINGIYMYIYHIIFNSVLTVYLLSSGRAAREFGRNGIPCYSI